MDKKVPNPNGKKGNEDHQNLVKILIKKLSSNFIKVKTEYAIRLPNGK